jgi:hypothetical protein
MIAVGSHINILREVEEVPALPHGPAIGAILAEAHGQHLVPVHDVSASGKQALSLHAPDGAAAGGAGAGRVGCTCGMWVFTGGQRHVLPGGSACTVQESGFSR